MAFELRGALPIATVMASAALALVIVHLDLRTLQSLVWRRGAEGRWASRSLGGRLLWLAGLVLVVGWPLYANLGARRGLGGQVPPAGRWEVLACQPAVSLPICRSRDDGRAVLYIEIGLWGQLVIGSERRSVTFSYDKVR